jgi:hypothetical protein
MAARCPLLVLGILAALGVCARNDGPRADTGFFPISDGPHFVEFDGQRATGAGATAGTLYYDQFKSRRLNLIGAE